MQSKIIWVLPEPSGMHFGTNVSRLASKQYPQFARPRSELAFHWKSFALQHACHLATLIIWNRRTNLGSRKSIDPILYIQKISISICKLPTKPGILGWDHKKTWIFSGISVVEWTVSLGRKKLVTTGISLEKLLYLLKLDNVGQVGYRFTDIHLLFKLVHVSNEANRHWTWLNMFFPNPGFAHTQTTHPNSMISLSPQNNWKHWLYAVILTSSFLDLGFRVLSFRVLGFVVLESTVKNLDPTQGF